MNEINLWNITGYIQINDGDGSNDDKLNLQVYFDKSITQEDIIQLYINKYQPNQIIALNVKLINTLKI